MDPGRTVRAAPADSREPGEADGVRSEGVDTAEVRTEALLAGVRSGDPAAFEALAAEHAPRLFRLAFHLTGRREEAEDLVQETLVRALPKLSSFEGRARLSTYLSRALANIWKNSLRSRSRSRIVDWLRGRPAAGPEEDVPAFDPPDRSPSAFDLLTAEDAATRVRSAVVRLEPDRRLALLLREVEELSYEEIAVVTGVPVGTVRSRLARARDDLRGLMGRRP